MQFIKKINKKKILKTCIIILSVPLIVQVLYYINLMGVYFGTFLRKLTYYIVC